MIDLGLGLAIGFLLGLLFKPIVNYCLIFFTRLLAKKMKSQPFLIIVSNAFTAIVVGLIFLVTLIPKEYVTVWDNYVFGWSCGFFLGAILLMVIGKFKR